MGKQLPRQADQGQVTVGKLVREAVQSVRAHVSAIGSCKRHKRQRVVEHASTNKTSMPRCKRQTLLPHRRREPQNRPPNQTHRTYEAEKAARKAERKARAAEEAQKQYRQAIGETSYHCMSFNLNRSNGREIRDRYYI
ncbi:hypothetical protein G7K_6246-t1 [Saitoella complicata NRRL Y-17804]|uniref:Uncharacterized protein n=1 Tax=Saitoella complicata (strain BCRC 22490 / CBS 7301 / JCM 7358 / NBRC 10748 / NRRL Y-17804) TaxID=698492 RepID=A0A0E9NQK5_SAICN|nr:hypothetical protein G7K_6246-t1 [Saitoella complicata NRRL Y-17804]